VLQKNYSVYIKYYSKQGEKIVVLVILVRILMSIIKMADFTDFYHVVVGSSRQVEVVVVVVAK
jgi:hypothetical protein